jgi:hypothetical protein
VCVCMCGGGGGGGVGGGGAGQRRFSSPDVPGLTGIGSRSSVHVESSSVARALRSTVGKSAASSERERRLSHGWVPLRSRISSVATSRGPAGTPRSAV